MLSKPDVLPLEKRFHNTNVLSRNYRYLIRKSLHGSAHVSVLSRHYHSNEWLHTRHLLALPLLYFEAYFEPTPPFTTLGKVTIKRYAERVGGTGNVSTAVVPNFHFMSVLACRPQVRSGNER